MPKTWPLWITHLDLSGINMISSLGTKAFAKLSDLRELRLDGNDINTLGSQSLDGLDQLMILMMNSTGISTIEGLPFRTLRNLQTLDLSYNKLGVIPGYNYLTCMDITYLYTLVNVQTLLVDQLDFSNCNEASFVHIPSVEILSIRGSEISDHLLKKLRLPNNLIRHVDLSENMIESAESGILLTLTHVVSLDLSRNPLFPESIERLLQGLKNSSIYVLKLQELGTREDYFSELRPTTFRPLNRTKLEELYFSRNNITTLSANSFVGLHYLKFLDLHDNKVGILSPDTFYGLTDLTTLKLDNNHLSDIEQVKEALKHLKSLKYLDLGYNKLTEISSFAFEGVPNLVKLVLENNEILNISRDSFGGLNDDESDDEPDDEYDAFVVYNEHDRDWVMGQLRPNLEDGDPPDFRLCLHERDFLPGTDIFENILDSIEKSHKTLLILSSHFAESEWCYFEMRMAQNHLFDGKRDVIVMILLEEIPDDKMPRVLRNILLTKRYLKWPNNRVGRRIFWQKLRLELKSENRVNRVANV
ncbi:toll-like receptor 13 [Ptychodera flava]|uniref:toll-like receptor 13 n=1 Tax=Ptychodera flava TaxID=63121 RepID=UPI00396AA917